MKKILFLILLFQSTFVLAGWSVVSESATDDIYYIDTTTLKKVNGYYEVWTLMDFDKPMEGSSFTNYVPIQSFKERLRISCSEDKLKTLTIIDYEGHNGKGKILNTINEEGNWRYPSPGSIIYSLLKKVCK